MAQLIDGVADVEKLQAGGVDAIMFGNENDRPYVFAAPPEGVAAMTAVVQAVKPALKVPFGVNYLWDPKASVAIGCGDRRQIRARDLHRRLCLRHGASGQPDCAGALRGSAQSRPRRHEAAVQHQCRIRPFARSAADRAARQERGLLLARRCDPGVGPDDRRAGRRSPTCARSRETVKDVPVFANTGVNIDNVADVLSIADGIVIGTHFKVDGNTWNAGRRRRVKRFMDKVATLR